MTVFEDFWAEDADYVGVDGATLHGRSQIQEFFRKLTPPGAPPPQQDAKLEQARFVQELAISDGSWTIMGASDPAGKDLAPIKGGGFEVFQKRHGRWWIVTTREMVIFKGN